MNLVQTLGTAEIRAGSLRVTPTSTCAFTALFYLAANGGRRVPRQTLCSLIYPGRAEDKAAHSLRQLLYILRGADVQLDADDEWLCMPSETIAADYTEIIEADRLTAEQIAKIAEGLLPGYTPKQSKEYAEWYEAQRAQISTGLLRRLLQELARSRRVGDWVLAERCARACRVLDPLNYEATCGLAEAMAAGGSKSLALALLDEFMKELGESAADLKRPAAILRKRISERMPAVAYRSRLDLPFIGREQEMLQLSEAFQRVRRGEAQCVVLSGEAGIGKTRIAAEFKTVALLEGARVERVVAQPQDAQRPMGAFIDLVPLLLQLPGALGCSPESMAALGRLTQAVSADEAPSGAAHDSEAVFYSITSAISDLVDALASEAPLVVVVEDAQWLDGMSLRLLADLVSERHERRLMVIVTTRSRAAFLKAAQYSDRISDVPLMRLGTEDAGQLVDAALSACRIPVDSDLTSWICLTSAGHPLFTSLLVVHYEQTLERFSVPPTITALIKQRIASVSPMANDVLRTCAILGRYCNDERLAATLEFPTHDLLQLLRELDSAGLIHSGTRVEFAHPLIADVALQGQPQIGTALLYSRVASILEGEATRLGEVAQLWDCAALWVAGSNPARALTVLKRCARHAFDIGRPEEGARTLMRALELIHEPTERVTTAADVIRGANSARDRELILAAFEIYRAAGGTIEHDDVELAVAYATALSWDSNNLAAERLTECCYAVNSTEDHCIRARTLLAKLADNGLVPLSSGVLDCLRDGVPLAEKRREEFAYLQYLVIYHTGFGDLDDAAVLAEQLTRRALGQDAHSVASILSNAGYSLWRSGQSARAIEVLEFAFQKAEESGLRRLQVHLASHLAGYLHDLARDEDRDSWWARAESLRNTYGIQDLDYDSMAVEMAMLRQDYEAARRAYDEAMVRHQALREGSYIDRWLRACGFLVKQSADNYVLADADIAELTMFHQTARDHGTVGDLAVEVLATACVRKGEKAAAEKMVDHYVKKQRLCRTPLRPGLRRIIASAG